MTNSKKSYGTILSRSICFLLAVTTMPVMSQVVLEEVVVTAERRSESVQDIANAITVFSGIDAHELGIKEPSDLAQQTPGLLTKLGPNGLATVGFYMRGVGINDFTGTVDSSVGIYVDEVFKSTPDTFNFSLFDLERIEVLKGPQGTLYGRNSTGGAVNFLSALPTKEKEGYIRAGYGSFKTGTLEGAVSGPLTETLLGRLSFSGQLSDTDSGYSFNRFTNNTLGDNDSLAVRGQLHWLPNEDFDARVIYNFGTLDSEQALLEHIGGQDANNPGQICAPVLAGRRAEGQCTGFLGNFDPDGDNRFDSDADVDPTLNLESHGIAAHINWDLSRFTVTSITSYEKFEKDQTQDIDSQPFPIGNNDTISSEVDSFSQEIRITSDDSWGFGWILGGFYFDGEINWFQTIDLSALAIPTSNGADQDTEAWAVFGHVTIPFAEKFEFEGGIRFTHEERKWAGGSFVGTFGSLAQAFASGTPVLSALPLPAGDPRIGGATDFDNNIEEDNVDFKASLKYHYDDDTMLYVTVSEAFRSGGISSAVIFSQEALEPFGVESLRAYEGGIKTSLADGRVELNVSGYYYDFEDYQATFVRGGEPSARLQNAGDVEIYGAEASMKWLVNERLFIDGGLSWLENEITKTDVVLTPLAGGAASTIRGNEIPNAPGFSINGRARYDFPLLGGFIPRAQVDFKYVDDHFLEPNNREVLKEDGYILVNARLGFKQENGPWEAAVWVKNLGDETYFSAAQDLFGALGFSERVIGVPRTWGVELGYKF